MDVPLIKIMLDFVEILCLCLVSLFLKLKESCDLLQLSYESEILRDLNNLASYIFKLSIERYFYIMYI